MRRSLFTHFLILLALLALFAACSGTGLPGPSQPVTSTDPILPAASPNTEPTTIQGLIVDSSNTPLVGARVSVISGSQPVPEIIVLTDQDGKYTWAVPEGTFTLEVHLDGYVPAQGEVTTTAGQVATLNFQLAAE